MDGKTKNAMNTNPKSEQAMPVPGTRGGERRKLILSGFHDCIINKGYAKTTLRDVAQAAGMSASHLLYYFSGKDAILEHYFNEVSKRITERIESFRGESVERQFELLADLFFAGKGITISEIGFMLECFGVAVHDEALNRDKAALDRACKIYLQELFEQSPCGSKGSRASAEMAYAMLIGLRTAVFFDEQVDLPRARGLFHTEIVNLANPVS
jgi:AcrR family transcriptional regulator